MINVSVNGEKQKIKLTTLATIICCFSFSNLLLSRFVKNSVFPKYASEFVAELRTTPKSERRTKMLRIIPNESMP